MRYTVINHTDGTFRVHAAKCADLTKPRNLGNSRFDVVVDDAIHANDPTEARRLVLADAWIDFIDEDNTAESFEGETRFLPCADLHRTTPTQEGPTVTTTAAPRFTTTAQVTQAIRAHMHVKTDELNMRTRIVGDHYVTSANPSAKYVKRTPDELAAMLVDWAGEVTTTEVGVRISTPVDQPAVEQDQAPVEEPAVDPDDELTTVRFADATPPVDYAIPAPPADLESEPVVDDVAHLSDDEVAEADLWREIDTEVAFEEKFGTDDNGDDAEAVVQALFGATLPPVAAAVTIGHYVVPTEGPRLDDLHDVLGPFDTHAAAELLTAQYLADGVACETVAATSRPVPLSWTSAHDVDEPVEELGDGRLVTLETSAATVVRIEHDEDVDQADDAEAEIVHPSDGSDQGEQVAPVELAERPNFVDRDEFPRADLLGVAEEDGVDVHPVLRLPLEPDFVPEFPTALDQPAPLGVDADMQYLTDRLVPGQVVHRPITTSANKTRTVAPCCGRYVPLPMSTGLYAPVACGWSCRLQYLVTKVDGREGEQVARFVVLGPTLVVSQYYPGRGKK